MEKSGVLPKTEKEIDDIIKEINKKEKLKVDFSEICEEILEDEKKEKKVLDELTKKEYNVEEKLDCNGDIINEQEKEMEEGSNNNESFTRED